MKDLEFTPDKPFSDAEISRIQEVIGRKLPKDYCEFVKKYGKAFVNGLFDGDENFPILTFFAADEDNGILYKLKMYSDLREEGILPFARCELGNLYVLTRDNSVHYINYYGGRAAAQRIADCFQDFVTRIVKQ